MKLAEKNFLWEVLVSNRENYPHYDHALVARSQAEAIIAAKDAKIAGAEEAHKTLIDVKNSIIEGLAKNLFVFAQDTGSRMTDLEANNAALTARVKELAEYAREATKAITGLTGGGSENFGKEIGDVFTADLPYCLERIRERYVSKVELKRLETKLAAAEKIAQEVLSLIAGDAGIPDRIRAKARAVLGGKPS